MNINDIDRQIGMPDVEQEWKRFEQDVIEKSPQISLPKQKSQVLLKRVAVIVSVCTLGFVALASAYFLGLFRATASSDTSEPEAKEQYEEVKSGGQDAFIFDEVELEEVMRTLCQHYAMQVEFRDEASKHVRLYITIDKDYTPVEVVDLINTFESVHISIDGNAFIIE